MREVRSHSILTPDDIEFLLGDQIENPEVISEESMKTRRVRETFFGRSLKAGDEVLWIGVVAPQGDNVEMHLILRSEIPLLAEDYGYLSGGVNKYAPPGFAPYFIHMNQA